MTGYASSYGTARVTPGVTDLVYAPRDGARGRRLVVLSHGYTFGGRVWIDDPSNPNTGKLGKALAAAGFACIALDFGNSFGNATASARVEAARVWAAANLGTATDKVCLVGISMGNLTSLGYRRDYPSRVAGVAGIIPASDMTDIYTNNRAGGQVDIGTAFSITYPTLLPAGADPTLNAAALAGVPYVAYYSSADAIVLPSTVTTLASALGGTATAVSSAAHGDACVAGVSVTTVARLLASWGA